MPSPIRVDPDRIVGCWIENAFLLLLEVDQMESIWGFTAADLLMRLPSVQESECECDISSELVLRSLSLFDFSLYIVK